MKNQIIFALAGVVLWGCTAADMKMVKEELARGAKDIKIKGVSRNSPTRRGSIKSGRSNIVVVNSKLPECKGITLHRAYVYHSPMYYGGKVLTTIPVYQIEISNQGKRRKVMFDIHYKQDFGNAKYGLKQPTRYYLKEYGPVTLRANTQRTSINIKLAEGREVYEKIELVACN